MHLDRLPMRVRLTLGIAASTIVLFAAIGASLYARTSAVLLDELDTGLRFRAQDLEAQAATGPNLEQPAPGLMEPDESVAQILGVDGHVVDSSPGIESALLAVGDLARVTGPTFFERRIAGAPGTFRLLAVPLGGQESDLVAVVGASTSDRVDASRQLIVFLLGAGITTLVVTSVVGWIVAGFALRPVERIRRQAAAISVDELDRRVPVPAARDELRLLAITLNQMLERLEQSIMSERRLLDTASHELRHPLTSLKAELDLARARPRSYDELTATIDSASEEADRLVHLAEDILVLARSREGRLELYRAPVVLSELAAASARPARARAEGKGLGLEMRASDDVVTIDAVRARQAIDNLLDNAIRVTDRGGEVRLVAEFADDVVRIVVSDTGPGFPVNDRSERPAGLGLAIAGAVAASHHGDLLIANRDAGGADVTLTLRSRRA